MARPIIEIDGIGKRYRIRGQRERYLSLRDEIGKRLSSAFRPRSSVSGHAEDFWALKDISFSVNEGEAVGIIGRNGAGKSTLLKILSEITPPTEGKITMHGRVASLLEVGTGFHQELTGRENIYLNGAILGMSRSEVKSKFDEIVAFSEVEKFLDTPVKRYSSGMYVRLAFAVAAHLEPEILLVDEVLAVGDAQFQKKCLGKMDEVTKHGRTVLFVSHNMSAIQALCGRTVLIEGGQVVRDGGTADTIARYLSSAKTVAEVQDFAECSRQGNGLIRIRGFRILVAGSQCTTEIPMGSEVTFQMEVESAAARGHADYQIGLYSHLMQRLCHFSSKVSGLAPVLLSGRRTVSCTIPALTLTRGRYILGLAIYDSHSWECYDRLVPAVTFTVVERDVFGSGRAPNPNGGFCYFPAQWEVVRPAVTEVDREANGGPPEGENEGAV